MDLPVELFAMGQRRWVALQDLSRSGMFLQTLEPLEVGAKVHVAIAPEGRRLVTTARVTHVLSAAEAAALGRHPGMGVEFREPADPADHLFAIAVERLVRDHRATAPAPGAHIVVGDSDTRLLERLSTALGEAGFSVSTATTGMAVLAACLCKTPDVVLLDRSLPVLDGLRVLEAMAHDPRLAAIPVIVTSSVTADIGPAFDRGAMDFIAKPMMTNEVIVRARRLAYASPRQTDRVILRGTLADVALSALLTMLEQERKTGRLALTGDYVGWLDIEDGVIVSAGSSRDLDAPTTLMSLLDWTHGTFELSSIAGPHDSELSVSIRHLLLEHAQRTDESSRVTRLPMPRLPTGRILNLDAAAS
jgi:CheY-like chemotaxis protein